MNKHEILALSSLTIFRPYNPLFHVKTNKFYFITFVIRNPFMTYEINEIMSYAMTLSPSVAVQLRIEMTHYGLINDIHANITMG